MHSQPDEQILDHAASDNISTADKFFASLYAELRRRARGQLRRLPIADSLRPTDLVHEAYVRLRMQDPSAWASRTHFLAVITTVMRNILIDTIRQKCTVKRGGGLMRVTLTESGHVPVIRADDLRALADALSKLERQHSDAARLVLLKFLMGLSMGQIADIDGVSKRTIERRWQFARAWLQAELAAS